MTASSDAFAAACQALTDALAATAVDPADGISSMLRFIGTVPVPLSADLRISAAQAATDALLRRSALVSLATICSSFNPSSSTQALAIRAQVAAVLDAEILLAADNGEDDTYNALRALRTAVVADLTQRAANLPAIVTVTTPQSEPSLTEAYRLYTNTRREPGMVARADVVHPMFMPTSFEALNQ